MAFENIPMTWDILAVLAGVATTGAAASWAIAHAISKANAKELEARLTACMQKSVNLATDLNTESLRVERFQERVREKDRLIEELERDLKKGMSKQDLEVIEELKNRVRNFDQLRDALLGSEDEVWKLRTTLPPADFAMRMLRSRTKVLTVINYKGGVGKTTIVGGLAAYLAARNKRVLVIDFDYQGSLTRTLILGARLPLGATILATDVIRGEIGGSQLVRLGRDLGATLPGVSLITCGHAFDGFEYRTMLRWLLGETKDDVRFRLANLILSEEVQREFDFVLIDAPPRASTGTINALCASHALVVPTVLDRLSVEAVGSFLARTNASFRPLNPALEFAGVVGTLTKATNLNAAEQGALNEARLLLPLWGGRSHLFDSRIRHFAALSQAAGRDVGYLQDRTVRKAFDEFGDELMGALHEDGSDPRHHRGISQAPREQLRVPESSVAARV